MSKPVKRKARSFNVWVRKNALPALKGADAYVTVTTRGPQPGIIGLGLVSATLILDPPKKGPKP